MSMLSRKRIAWPLTAGLLGSGGLALLYFGIVSLAESPAHALELFWDDRWIVLPIILSFGIQAALYVVLKKGLFLPDQVHGSRHLGRGSTAYTGASGGMSTAAMVACCAHHVADVLPILGLTAAATFLAQYRLPFMLLGLGSTLLGIAYMSLILVQERRKALERLAYVVEAV